MCVREVLINPLRHKARVLECDIGNFNENTQQQTVTVCSGIVCEIVLDLVRVICVISDCSILRVVVRLVRKCGPVSKECG